MNLSGMKFGKLEIIEETKERSKDRQKIYMCKCECGKLINIRSGDLKSGNTKSCGCAHYKANNLTNDPLYKRVCKAYERTHAKGTKNHIKYQEKGINFEFDSKEEMYNYLLPKWNEAIKNNILNNNLHIDRIDNSKGYAEGNMRIVTRKVNNRNRDITLKVTVKNIKTGEEIKNIILAEFCETKELNYKTLHARYMKKVKNPKDGWVVYAVV